MHFLATTMPYLAISLHNQVDRVYTKIQIIGKIWYLDLTRLSISEDSVKFHLKPKSWEQFSFNLSYFLTTIVSLSICY